MWGEKGRLKRLSLVGQRKRKHLIKGGGGRGGFVCRGRKRLCANVSHVIGKKNKVACTKGKDARQKEIEGKKKSHHLKRGRYE